MTASRFAAVLTRLLLCCLAVGWAAMGMAQAPVFPGASNIGLAPPPGMVPSTGFAGFEHRSGASIILIEFPAEAYAEIAARFTPDGLRPSGFEMRGAAEPLALDDGEGLVARGGQSAHGARFRKWIVLARLADVTAMVTVQVPEGTAEIPDKAVEAALASIVIRPPRSAAEELAAVPYSIGDLAGFRIVRSFLGNSLLLTDGERDADPAGDQPMVVVAHSLGEVWTAGQEAALARRAAADIQQLDDIRITQEAQAEQDGVKSVRLRGEAKDATTGRDLHFSQTMLFRGSDYLRIIAITPPARAEALERADVLAASIVWSDPAGE